MRSRPGPPPRRYAIPEDEDIASGTSLDLDGNGLPDECNAMDLDLSLSTGYDQRVNPPALLPGGASDDDWQVVNAPTPGPAKVLLHPHVAWQGPLANSRWISVEPDQGTSIPGLPVLQFENCFCLSDKAASAELDVQLRADDSAQVLLNGKPLGSPGGEHWNPTPLHVQLAGAVGGDGPFKAGQNCLRVEVRDIGGVVTGLDLAGTVRAADGLCAN